MAGGLGLLATLGAGRMGVDFLRDRREAERNEILQSGIRDALGTAPSVFDADLFPGEAPIPGLYNAGTGLAADPNSIENQLQFATDIFNLPGGQEFGGSIFRDALGYAQQRYDRDRITEAGLEEQKRDLAQRQNQWQQEYDADQYWNWVDAQQQAYEFEQGRTDTINKPPSNFQWAVGPGGVEVLDSTGNRLAVPMQNSEVWRQYKGAQNAMEESITTIDELINGVQEYGTEQLPGEIKGKLRALSAILTLDGKNILDTGALAQDELELIQKAVADPTTFFQGRTNAEIVAGYTTILEKLQRGLRRHNQETSFWPGMGSKLDQMTPSQMRRQQAQAQAQAEAEAMGLTDQPPGLPTAPPAPPGLRGRGIGAMTQGAPPAGGLAPRMR